VFVYVLRFVFVAHLDADNVSAVDCFSSTVDCCEVTCGIARQSTTVRIAFIITVTVISNIVAITIIFIIKTCRSEQCYRYNTAQTLYTR